MSKRPTMDKKRSNDNCLIVGNGPSFKESIKHHSNIDDKTIICVNFFPLTDYFETVKPSILLIAAPELYNGKGKDSIKEKSKALFTQLGEKSTWQIQVCLPVEARKHKLWQKPLLNNPNIDIRYYNNTPIEGWRWFENWCFKHQLGSPRPHNVLIPCLTMAIGQRFKKVYLIGADHNWLNDIFVTDDNKVMLTHKHFYDQQNQQPATMHKGGSGERKMHEVLEKFMISFKSYWILKYYAEANDVEVFNLTPGSYIDAFERRNILTL